MAVLQEILARKKDEVRALRARSFPKPPPAPPVHLARESGAPLRLICEIKRKSPSAGKLSTRLSVADRAALYERGGATMISVLCDEHFFAGSYDHLTQARAGCDLPLLCKEFIIDELQLEAARAHGASAALLIVRCLENLRLQELLAACRALSLVPLVEVVTREEARCALDAGADHIGVNARDLDTLEIDRARAQDVLGFLPPSIVRCTFSGLANEEAVAEAARSGVDAALIGEVLMREDDPTQLLEAFGRAAEKTVP